MQVHRFEFTGNVKEYFGIWIVNLLLSIITIGIYTAWAKVRRVRYFYANTYLDGHNFEYHASPKAILIGRIIVFGILVGFQILVQFKPEAGLLFIPFLFVFPWIINRAIRFNARVTSYRNIRFNFAGTYWRAFLVFIVMPVVAILTLGILAPVASRMSSNYIGNNLRYGSAQFSTDAPLGLLYRNWGGSLGILIIGTAIIAGIGFAIITLTTGSNLNNLGNMDDLGYLPLIPFALVILANFIVPFYKAGVRNIAYNSTTLEGGHGFNSNLGRLKYVWILFSNLFATILTIGMLRPWAAIRSWRYQIEHTSLEAGSDLGSFIEQREREGAAASSEFLDIEGVDFGL